MKKGSLVVVILCASLVAIASCSDDDGKNVRSTPTTVTGSGTDDGAGSASGPTPTSGAGTESGSPPVAPACRRVGDAKQATTTVEVQLSEYEITTDATRVRPGRIHFALDNVGTTPHEFVIVKGVAPDDLPRTSRGALDQSALPAGALVGEVEPFDPGVLCHGTFALAAGKYTLLCNVVAGGTSHLHEGMVTQLTVA